MNGGPLGCISVLASPESNTTAPLIPLSLIASISRVIPSLLTDPFTHRHHTHVRDSTGGTENSRRKSYASSACNAASGVSSMAKISVMVCFIMGMLVRGTFMIEVEERVMPLIEQKPGTRRFRLAPRI